MSGPAAPFRTSDGLQVVTDRVAVRSPRVYSADGGSPPVRHVHEVRYVDSQAFPCQIRFGAFAAFLALVLSSQATLAAVTWSAPVGAGPTYSWNYGQALARTKSGTTNFLHTQYTTDFVNGMFVADNGPYMGVYYRRGTRPAQPGARRSG